MIAIPVQDRIAAQTEKAERAHAKAIEALCGLLDETADPDVFEDPPEQEDTEQPAKPRLSKGRALRYTIRLRSALALLRVPFPKPPREHPATTARESIRSPRSSTTSTSTSTRAAAPHTAPEIADQTSPAPEVGETPPQPATTPDPQPSPTTPQPEATPHSAPKSKASPSSKPRKPLPPSPHPFAGIPGWKNFHLDPDYNNPNHPDRRP